MRSRLLSLAPIAVVAILGLAALGGLGWWVTNLGGGEPLPGPPAQDRLRPQGGWFTGIYPEPEHLNPFTTSEAVARRCVLPYTHDTLLDLDPETAALRPALAEVESQAADGRSFVFALRPGVCFADGTPLQMSDVLFTFAAVSDPALPAGAMGVLATLVERLEPLDARRFRVVLRRPYFAALGEIGTEFRVVQEAWFRAEVRRLAAQDGVPPPAGPGQPGFAQRLAMVREPGPGTGPYRIDTWAPNRELRLVRNERSWRRAAQPECWNLSGLRLLFVRDPAAALTELRKGSIDWLGGDTADLERLLAEPELAASYRLLRYDTVRIGPHLVVWNHRRPPLDRAEVRRALTMLFDRAMIADKLLHGEAVVAASWFKPGTPLYPEHPAPLPFDTAAARELLQRAGYGGPGQPVLRLGLLASNNAPLHQQIQAMAVDTFQEAGVTLVPDDVDYAAWNERRDARDFDGLLMLWTHSPWIDPWPDFHGSQGDGGNVSGWRCEESDRLLDAAREELDRTKRTALYQRWNEVFAREQPVSLLVYPRAAMLLHRRFQDAEPGALGLVSERWWVALE